MLPMERLLVLPYLNPVEFKEDKKLTINNYLFLYSNPKQKDALNE